ncbi:AcrR family transcriptional regulator [Arthrobacter silviterrae]|uniref:TetR/AcrR family transcriptional regulator n=1 Tax=Arthrobacter silviterrae TaxID=2026658 RepID=A0ABX0D4Y2_9MICC|nr:TetR family transcriptional regulator [Arthrobacter silviterrae]MDQ0279580.1 AcrR family transcriptional regulator [Arthrobacter silviterrae]NGN81943.1 TetR/AcrR family transcriptional regulator [Arthrobacter silviterrae]
MNGQGAHGGPARGRRQGRSTSRRLILASARKLFAEHGYAATSLREIARDAGVDAAMVHHWFASKEELFNACVELPADPAQVLGAVSETPADIRGEALLRALLALWDSGAQPALLALLRNVAGSKAQGSLIRQVLFKRILTRALAGLPGSQEELDRRGALLASQMIGLMVARYLLRVEPLASAGHDELVALVAPVLQNYLTGPLGFPAAPGGGTEAAAHAAPVMGSSAHRRSPAPAPSLDSDDQLQSWERE